MMMTYCWGDRALSSLRAKQGGIVGPDDPKLRNLVQQATLKLLPARDIDAGNDNPDFEP
jgi:hypothetical protein